MEKIGYINDPKEREHYTLKRCCGNCANRRARSPLWPFRIPWCEAKKKHLGCDMSYDHGCRKFLPVLTPEENKRWILEFKETTRRKRCST